ncbi:MAG: LacI family DNA-binding transcriptional regulator, partial [Candidatus Borkfalkia sp.]
MRRKSRQRDLCCAGAMAPPSSHGFWWSSNETPQAINVWYFALPGSLRAASVEEQHLSNGYQLGAVYFAVDGLDGRVVRQARRKKFVEVIMSQKLKTTSQRARRRTWRVLRAYLRRRYRMCSINEAAVARGGTPRFDAARLLNYRPDRIAQSLAGSRTHTLAYMTADIANTYQLEVIKGMQTEALKNDYIVYIFDAAGDVKKYVSHLITRRVDGIFVSAAPDFLSDELLCELRDANIKVLADFSRSTFLPDVSYIMSDMYDGFMQAVGFLKELGHTEIGYLSAFDESCYYDLRLPAFKIAMRKLFGAGVPPIEFGGWPYSTSETLGIRLMTKMLSEHPEVTAIVATNDLMALGAIKAAIACGRRVPEDISVIGID